MLFFLIVGTSRPIVINLFKNPLEVAEIKKLAVNLSFSASFLTFNSKGLFTCPL